MFKTVGSCFWKLFGIPFERATSISSSKTRVADAPALELLERLFLIQKFTEVITFSGTSAHQFQPDFKLLVFEIGHLFLVQYKFSYEYNK